MSMRRTAISTPEWDPGDYCESGSDSFSFFSQSLIPFFIQSGSGAPASAAAKIRVWVTM